MSIDSKKRLQDLLIELFQLDKTDLDFGIYRIMNLRAADVNHFISEVLPAKLDEVTAKLASKSVEDKREEIETAKEGLQALAKLLGKQIKTDEEIAEFCKNNPDAEPVKAYLVVREEASQTPNTEDLERDIYNDLFRFFDRYYEGGDFVTKPRAGESTFMIPYNGEETKFYWANHDQYYIKTGENFKNYVFTNGETDEKRKTIVEFRLVEVETEVNNNQNKKGRVFIPIEDYFDWDADERKLTLKFYYKVPSKEEKETWGDKQSVKAENKGINERLVFTRLDSKIRETGDAFLIRFWEKEREVKNGKNPEKQNEFYYHLNRYTSINSFDYFIHTDLGKFLRQELDYFIKHEIFSLNFLADDWGDEQTQKAIQQNVMRASVIRDIATQIIDFLAEIENFQKALYEKKKFVVQSDYCITLDLIPENVIGEIVTFTLKDTEQKQIKEWQKLGFIESPKIKTKDFSNDGYLVLDTQFLPFELKFKLLSAIENLDEKIGGLLIQSENYQALNLLHAKYKDKVNCIYIDPPYNSDAGPISYKNGYQHSSWLALIENRLQASKSFLIDSAILCITIDDYEAHRLRLLCDTVFTNYDILGVVAIKNNPAGRTGTVGFSVSHEYAYFYGHPEYAEVNRLEHSEAQKSRYKEKDEFGFFEWTNFRKHGGANTYRETRPRQYYPIYVRGQKIRIPEMTWDNKERQWIVHEQPKTGEKVLLPIDNKKRERIWDFVVDTARKHISHLMVKKDTNGEIGIYRKWRINDEGLLPQTIWDKSIYSAAEYGTNLLTKLFGVTHTFMFPKSVYAVMDCIKVCGLRNDQEGLVLDYFAGSGTSGHAVLNLNREDEGGRKYILTEMGEYFETVTKPRIQKVVYSVDWNNGRPILENKPLIESEYKSNGISHIFQYIKLEQYEDTLNNIEFDESREKIASEFEFLDHVKYLLRYSTTGSPSLLAINQFAQPFDYQMDIIRLNERVPMKIDLVTTFNYLLGINVIRYRTVEHQNRVYHIIEGIKKKQAYLIIWRNFSEDLKFEEERDFIKQGKWFDQEALIYANADNAFGADSIEAEFKRLMFEDVNFD